jgi:phage terminase Nu1 subunit (DNA packaging protein)
MTQAAFGEMVGVSQQAVSEFFRVAALGPGLSGAETLIAYCERLREVAAGRGSAEVGGLDLVQERAALAREQRLGYEIKNAVARGEFAPIALLAEVLAMASQAVVERFEQLPGMLKKACPEMPDAGRDQVMTVLAAARNEWEARTRELVVKRLEESGADPEEVVDV